jgi:hypothetical protein
MLCNNCSDRPGIMFNKCRAISKLQPPGCTTVSHKLKQEQCDSTGSLWPPPCASSKQVIQVSLHLSVSHGRPYLRSISSHSGLYLAAHFHHIAKAMDVPPSAVNESSTQASKPAVRPPRFARRRNYDTSKSCRSCRGKKAKV